jgi:integration host factor subunit alpha
MNVHLADRQRSSLSGRKSQDSGVDAPSSGKALTRIQLLDAVYQACPRLSRAEARGILNMTIEEVASALVRGEKVEIRSFGAFYVRSKSERLGRNPRNGDPAPIAARRVARFKPSSCLIERVGAAGADKS